ncbi:MAG: type II toxin-antitoxin system Phd/YefM family antitoxin [Burkholderiales bacterium]
MGAYSIAEAKAQLSALVQQAEQGESITLTKRGKPVARIVSITAQASKPRVDLERLRAFRARMPRSPLTSADMVRKMRDGEPGW